MLKKQKFRVEKIQKFCVKKFCVEKLQNFLLLNFSVKKRKNFVKKYKKIVLKK